MNLRDNPVWMLFQRRIFSRLAYWLTALGYNLRDRSLNNRIYFVYFCVYWIVWVFAVLTMLGSSLAWVLRSMPISYSPDTLVVLFFSFLITTWGLIQLWKVTGRSPFIFGESDAYLLCQTPVDRRTVAFAWFLMDWFGIALVVAALSILVSFALVDITIPHEISIRDLPIYITAGLRALVINLPFQMGVQAFIWGIGALRLQRDDEPDRWNRLHLFILLPGMGLAALTFLPGLRVVVYTPLAYVFQAASSIYLAPSPMLVPVSIVLLILALGMISLYFWAEKMHLGRAAQETQLYSSIRQARSSRNFELVSMLNRQGRMSATRSPSRLPGHSGVWMLVWKSIIQTSRSLNFVIFVRWVWVFFLYLGVFMAPNWVTQLILGAIWSIVLGGLLTNRLRSDLARWWLLRSLPLRNSGLLVALLGPASGFGLLLGWIAIVIANPPAGTGWLAAGLLPFLIACAALGSARDILNRTTERLLMTPDLDEANVPRLDIKGVMTILMSVGFPLGMFVWGSIHKNGLILILLSIPVALLITILNYKAARSAFH